MSLVHLMCYLEAACMPLLCCLSVWGFALIPQLCLFNGIPLYPKISDSNFIVFSIIFISAISKSLYEVVSFGDQFKVWKNEWRIWMVKSVTCYTYGSLDAILNKLGIKEASFLPTNKVTDDEQVKLYEMGIFDFRAATMFLAPLVTVILVNFVAFAGAVVKALVMDDNGDRYWEKMFSQMFLSFYILVSNYAIIEGMIIRKDKSSIPLSATLRSVVFSVFILLIGSVILC
ncbi:cellulose synthase-like protein E1 [Gossypium arboreum]|uniref:cellulose synthase-like protein E1 n=1 Tax=Gossypium arboreum TaxID=29729 RepID=UPI0022F149FD|nr:cellulose synthase-like protein E1 [Gossypium arboreum]